MDNQQATLSDLGWLAGIIDGEGYLGLRKQWVRRNSHPNIGPELHICNTDEAIVLKAARIMRELGVNAYVRGTKAKGVKKDVFKVQVKHFAKTIRLLTPLLPYLTGNKQERATLIIRFCELRTQNQGVRNPNIGDGRRGAGRIKPYTDEEWAIYEQVGPLTRRGASEATREVRRLKSEVFAAMDARKGALSRNDMVQAS